QARNPVADRYGLALSYLKNSQPELARVQLAPLIADNPRRLAYVLANAEIDIAAGQLQRALTTLETALRINPGNHPLTMLYADALLKTSQPHRAAAVLQEHTRRRESDPAVWYLLAETYGLSGNI